MKKATLGMVMLVSLVLTKAYISKDEQSVSIELGRDNSTMVTAIESNTLRADHYGFGKSNVALLAQDLSNPKIEVNQIEKTENQEFTTDLSSEFNTNENIEIVEEPISVIEEEVVPMDYISNTGYGLLKTTTEKIISKQEREGKEPLDNGNTISDNISKMFPRSL